MCGATTAATLLDSIVKNPRNNELLVGVLVSQLKKKDSISIIYP